MSPKHRVLYTAGGEAWGMEERGGFWGPYSQRPSKDLYFNRLVKALLDAGAIWDRTHVRPPGFPFSLLGKPCAVLRGNEINYHGANMGIIMAGGRLEFVTQRLRLLACEWDCFHALVEVTSPEGSHAER